MKKLSILFLMCAAMTVAVNAQEFKPFKVGLGLGYAKPGGEGASGGVLWYLEPGYRISDALLVNLRIEGALVVRGLSDAMGEDPDLDVAAISSYTVNGQYYFSNNSFRPFAGVGLGLFSLAAIKVDGDGGGEVAAGETKFGAYPRVGFDAGHFNLSLDYNIIPATKVDGFSWDENGNVVPAEYKFKNSYLGVRLGVSIGGGRK